MARLTTEPVRPLATSVFAIGPKLLSGLSGLSGLDVSPVGHVAAFVIAGIFLGVLVVRYNKQRRIQGPSLLRTK